MNKMITKEIQDKTWASMPEECRQAYREEYGRRVNFGTHESEWEIERLFGKRNLISKPDRKTAKQEFKERIAELQRVIDFRAKRLNNCYKKVDRYKREIRDAHYHRSIANDFYTEDLAHTELNEAYKRYNAYKERMRFDEQEQRECKKQFKELSRKLCQYGN